MESPFEVYAFHQFVPPPSSHILRELVPVPVPNVSIIVQNDTIFLVVAAALTSLVFVKTVSWLAVYSAD